MPSSHRTSTLPLSGSDLEALRASLARHYGAQVWEAAGERILVVRVPRPEPDIIQDIEAAIEHLVPADVNDLTHALLVGDAKPLAVPVHPFQQLMQQRLQADDEQAKHLRLRLKAGQHILYKAAGDPRKVLRLGLRLGKPSVADWDDHDLDHWATTLAADLDAGRLDGVVAVHLVADQDAARSAAGLVLQDLRQHRAEARARQELAARVAQRQAAVPPARVAYAPLRSAGTTAAWPDEGTQALPTDPSAAQPASRLGPSAPATAPDNDGALRHLQDALAKLGYDVLLRPAGHAIDVAAERDAGDVRRIIAWVPERLTVDVASAALRTTRGLDCDLALVVCDDAEPEARKRLIATKVRWLQPKDLANLDL